MANNKSAKKRIKINERNRLQNRFYKSSVRTLMNNYLKIYQKYNNQIAEESLPIDEKEKLQKLLKSIYSLLDKGKKKNVFHKNFVTRTKTRLASSIAKHPVFQTNDSLNSLS